ncbi:MAG: hypothetical protein ACREO5_09625 [Candidatus Binatia bacterium]
MSFFGHMVTVTITGVVLILPSTGRTQSRNATARSTPSRAAPSDAELVRLRADVMQKMKESRAGAEKLIALREEEIKKLQEEYEKRRELYSQGLIARVDLNKIERLLAEAMVRADGDKRWLTEQDIAITEVSMRDDLLRLPGLALGGYSETGTLIRFNGAGAWSLADAPKIQKFFSQNLGRVLPISAYGQTATHDRLHFDHRSAVDVALHPDSSEGRLLISYLRQNGIPFIAFKTAVPGSATGAHIHIGRPSPSLRAASAH